jgi:transcriptional regulator MraZ
VQAVLGCFTETFTNKLDAKGRVSIPSSFRQVLAGQGTDGVYVLKAVSGQPALTAFGDTLLSSAREQLKPHHPILSRGYAPRAQAIFGQARRLAFDDEGRVRLPDDLIAHIGVRERVSFVGLNDIFEIWNPETFEPVQAARLDDARNIFDASGDAP